MSKRERSLFDPSAARGPSETPRVGSFPARSGDPAGAVSVSGLLHRIKSVLGEAFSGKVLVRGEISNFKRHSSGHLYFSLKDASAAVAAVMFRSSAARVRFEPTDGLEVFAEGRMDVFERQGKLQLYVESLQPKGEGSLELALRQCREKLSGEGLFDIDRKKPIPRIPAAVGVLTSATGAAVRDIQRTLRRRWPAVRVYLLPVAVQGAGAAQQIARALADMDAAAERFGIETIILGRGGGSLEDLWCFNEEVVVRAVAAARTPIISGVGHEVDTTLCDLAADLRAATPTAASEAAVPDRRDVRDRIDDLAVRIRRGVEETHREGVETLHMILRSDPFRAPQLLVRPAQQALDEVQTSLRLALTGRVSRGQRTLEPLAGQLAALHPARLAERASARLAEATARLQWGFQQRRQKQGDVLDHLAGRLAEVHPRHRINLARQQLTAARRELEIMSHRSVLRRGFSITRDARGRVLRSVRGAKPGLRLRTELADGVLESDVVSHAEQPSGRARSGRAKQPEPREPELFD